MSTPPPLFDETLRLARRNRAALAGPAAREPLAALHDIAAERLVERLEPINRAFPAVLIAAAATGAYAATLRVQITPQRLVQLEQSPPLLRELAAAGDLAQSGALGALTAEELAALGPESFDLVLIGLDLHGRNDPIAALTQARLLLKPDGLLLAAMIGGDSLSELRACLAEAEVETTGGLSPRISPMGEVRELGGLLQRAGFAMPVADSENLTLWHRSPLHLMREIRAIGESNALTERRKRFMRRDMLARCLSLYAERFSRADGKTRATLEIVTLTGWAPAPDQQKPLRPGSAAARLADALGAEELKSGDQAPRPPQNDA